MSAPPTGSRFVDARCVARTYGVGRDFVYAHADELGAVRLGTGPRARLRFDLAEVDRRLRGSPQESATRRPTATRTRPRTTSTKHLIPYEGM
jgi:hypothetical protein